MPLIWRICTIGIVVSGIGVAITAPFVHHYKSLSILVVLIMSLGAGTFLSSAVTLFQGRDLARSEEQHRGMRLLVLHDPGSGMGVDRPNRQFYLWFVTE
jgi:hypothetical protein